MDFWQEFCQYVADLTSNTKDKLPYPPIFITFQEWIRLKTCYRKPPPPVDEWVDAWNERLRFYSENYSVVLDRQGCFHLQNFDWILDKPPYLRKFSQWEMKAIFERLEMKENENKVNFSKTLSIMCKVTDFVVYLSELSFYGNRPKPSSGVPGRSKYSHFSTASIFGSVGIAFWEGLYEGASTER